MKKLNPTSFSAFLLSISYLTFLGTNSALRTPQPPEEHPESPPSHANKEKCLHVMSKSLFHIYLFVQLVNRAVNKLAALRVTGINLGSEGVSLGLTNNLVEVVSAILGDHGGGVVPACS